MTLPVARVLPSLALLGALLGAVPATAADVAYPTGSRLGLAPPPGMSISRNFQGFEDVDSGAGMVFAILPQRAYAELEKEVTPDKLKREGITIQKTEKLQTPVGKA